MRTSLVTKSESSSPSPQGCRLVSAADFSQVMLAQEVSSLVERISLVVCAGKPVLALNFQPREWNKIDFTALAPLEDDPINVFAYISSCFPDLSKSYVRGLLYQTAVKLQSQDLKNTDFCHLSRVVHRFGNYFAGTPKEYTAQWKENLGCPLALVLQCKVLGEWFEVNAQEVPLLGQVSRQLDQALTSLSRDYLAIGRIDDFRRAEHRAKEDFAVFGNVLRLRQLGFTSLEVQDRIAANGGEKLSVAQITAWTCGFGLPPGIRNILVEVRQGKGNSLHLPDKPSADFSYLLGVHVGSARFESVSESFSLVHDSNMVFARVCKALKAIGIEDLSDPFARKGLAKGQKLLRVRSTALAGTLYELTYGHTRLPWPYLCTKAEKIAFVKGICDSLAVVSERRVHFTKAHAEKLLQDFAILLAELGVYSEMGAGEKTRLHVNALPDIQQLHSLIGRRYPEFDRRMSVACQPRGKHQITVDEYQRFQKAVDVCGIESSRRVWNYLKDTEGMIIAEPTVRRWMKGEIPPAVQRMNQLMKMKDDRPEIEQIRELVKKGVPRSDAIRVFET